MYFLSFLIFADSATEDILESMYVEGFAAEILIPDIRMRLGKSPFVFLILFNYIYSTTTEKTIGVNNSSFLPNS